MRVTGYGPLFDEGAYEQDGHIRIDFGSDTPFLEEDADLDLVGARHVEENVRQLVELAGGGEKASGATAPVSWSAGNAARLAAVSMSCGATALTRMPCGCSSRSRMRTRWMSAALRQP